MNEEGTSKSINDDKIFIRLDDDNINDNNDVDLLTSFKASFHTLNIPPVIDIEDDDDNNNNNVSSSELKERRKLFDETNPNPGALAQPFTCTMCTNLKPKYQSINIKGCTHFYCCECIEKYVSFKLSDGAIEINCPNINCFGTLDPEYCKDFVWKDIYCRWGEQLCESAIVEGERCYCPFVDCSGLLVNDVGQYLTMVECPYCHRMFCANCRSVWHQGVSCQDNRRP